MNKFFRPIVLRNDEGHRQATWLELFMDLAFVVSMRSLTVMLVEDHSIGGFILYCLVFFAVFWAWNQLTWYAIFFDNNDFFYRVIYLGSVLFILVLSGSFSQIARGVTYSFVLAYVMLNFLLVVGWVRVYFSGMELKDFSFKFAAGKVLSIILFLASMRFPAPQQYYLWGLAMAVHAVFPYFAYAPKATDIPIHLDHVVERYCLFTIIMLGEALFALKVGFVPPLRSEAFYTALLSYIVIACIWWSYFNWDFGSARNFGRVSNTFCYGYGHCVVFFTIATFGAAGEIATNYAIYGFDLQYLEKYLMVVSVPLYLVSICLMNRLSWNMPFDKIMIVRLTVAILSLGFSIVFIHLSPVLIIGGIALMMVIMIVYEQLNVRVS